MTPKCAEPQSRGDQSGQGGTIKRREKLKLGRALPTKWGRKHFSLSLKMKQRGLYTRKKMLWTPNLRSKSRMLREAETSGRQQMTFWCMPQRVLGTDVAWDIDKKLLIVFMKFRFHRVSCSLLTSRRHAPDHGNKLQAPGPGLPRKGSHTAVRQRGW